MSPSPPSEPLPKGRKTQSTFGWYNVLPTGPSLYSGQEVSSQHYSEASHRSNNAVSGGVSAPSIPPPAPQTFQRDLLPPQLIQPKASRLQVPQLLVPSDGLSIPSNRPRTPLSRSQTPLGQANTSLTKSLTPSNRPQTPSNRPHTPSNRPHTPSNYPQTPSNRPHTPSNRPQTPRSHISLGRSRPPSIVVPPPSQNFQRVVAYNPSELSETLEVSPPIAHGRRNLPVQASSRAPSEILPTELQGSASPSGPVARGSSKNTTYMTIPRCKRGLLIIGSSHEEPTPYTAELPPLLGVKNDRDMLREAFRGRQYSVETMVEKEGDKREILRKVGNFLATAEQGDVRMVVFTGHAAKIGTDRQIAIIPYGCTSDDDTISSAEWQDTVLKNAVAGVVVISVFATCMSGAMVQQSVRLTNFDRIIERQSLATGPPNGPIQIILSSSGDTQNSFEYHTPLGDTTSSSWHDYFLWALAETTRRTDIDNWESFVKTLQSSFTYVRAVSFQNSTFQYPQDLNWLLHNPQTPRIFVSSQMPDFNDFLPRQNH